MQTAPRQSRRASRRGRNRRGVMAEINVTPFVDVMLVLLIIFMVAAPLLQVGVPLQLPESAANAVGAEPEEPLTISVPSTGPVMLIDSPVDEGTLITRLREIAETRQSRRIFLRADGTIPYARIMQVMGALNAAGFNDLVLVTDAGGPRMDN